MEKLRKDIEGIYKWNLTDLIKDDEEYQELVTKSYMLIDKIVAMRNDLLKSSNNFLMYLKTQEELDKTVEKVYVYSNLYFYQDMNNEDGKKYKDSAEKLFEDMNLKLAFIRPLLLNFNYETIKEYIKENKELEKYAFTLEKIFRYKKYTLSEKEEEIVALANNSLGTSENVFSAIDNVDIDLGYIKDESGKKVKLNNSNYIKYCSSKDRMLERMLLKICMISLVSLLILLLSVILVQLKKIHLTVK